MKEILKTENDAGFSPKILEFQIAPEIDYGKAEWGGNLTSIRIRSDVSNEKLFGLRLLISEDMPVDAVVSGLTSITEMIKRREMYAEHGIFKELSGWFKD